jgi:hypothetical protein
MILKLSTQIQIKAMLKQMTRAEVLDRLDVPEYTLDAALRGQDIPAWEAHNITDGIGEWEGSNGDN